MIHYSILPIYTPEEEPPSYELVDYKGHEVLACKTEEGYVVERIYSTNPNDFKLSELLPGSVLEQCFVNKKI